MSKRLSWLDCCKGATILLVVLGHVADGYLRAGAFPEHPVYRGQYFFRRFGNPAGIRTQAGEGYIMLSAELYDRMAELCGFPGTKKLIDREPRT